jgi:outer membrane receptor protein involved in Fe transport
MKLKFLQPVPTPVALAILSLCTGALAQTNDAVIAAAAPDELSAQISVTGTREKALLAETPASVGVIRERDIRFTAPAHPQQLLGQVPGVAIAVTNGEGHSTAIRQPFTTNPVYLYLEDGIPTRATGFFNHNALYEVDIPGAASVEVVRGPNTALYGSDAIGGTVNILTRAPSMESGGSATGELGSFGWRRLLLEGSTPTGEDAALRAAANLTHSGGWRDGTSYDRQSVNLRWDAGTQAGTQFKTILGATHIDQQTGANSPLTYGDYLNNPTKNNMAIAFRKVDALRLSTQAEHEAGGALFTLTPYLRHNVMELNGSFNLSSDPRIETTRVTSLGVLAKWRQDFGGPMRPRLIAGLDLDHSQGSHAEDSLNLTKTGTGADTVYTGYTLGSRIYEYDVRINSASPYVHGEISPTPALRLTAGLRYDVLRYHMSNDLAGATTAAGPRLYAQTPQADADYTHLSPKLGATYALAPNASLYASYNQGFRTPSEGQLFRAGSATTAGDAQAKAQAALGLQPIKASQFELGLRGDAGGWGYDVAAYELIKRNDLVTQRDLATNVTTTVNAGKTRHRGIEVGLHKGFAAGWRLDTALSYAKHTYVDWVTSSGDFSGKEMESAPRVMANTRVSWTPRDGTTAQLEWVHLGSYWLEASNSPVYGKYPGHDVFNLRVQQRLSGGVTLFGRVMNLADKRYADSASVSSLTPVFSPALPRTFYAGLEATW